jgi:hypothetical protein
MFNYSDSGLAFDRQSTDEIVNHYKGVLNLNIVGWFINKDLNEEITSMHITLSVFKLTQFLLVTGKVNREDKDVELVAYNSLDNKYFKSCFGALDKVPLVVDLCANKYRKVLKNLVGDESVFFRELKDVLDAVTDDDLNSHPELKKELFLVLKNKFNFSQKQIQEVQQDYLKRYNNYSELLDAYEKEITLLMEN